MNGPQIHINSGLETFVPVQVPSDTTVTDMGPDSNTNGWLYTTFNEKVEIVTA